VVGLKKVEALLTITFEFGDHLMSELKIILVFVVVVAVGVGIKYAVGM